MPIGENMFFKGLGKLLVPDVSGLRREKDAPEYLLTRADRKAINFQRQRLLNKFGFEETILDRPERDVTFLNKKETKVRRKEERKTQKARDQDTLL